METDLKEILDQPAFSLDKAVKAQVFLDRLKSLSDRHYRKCPEYRRILDALECRLDDTNAVEGLPYLPVRLFKEFSLRSVDEDEVVKTMTSSGTSGQSVSRIFLDRATAAVQTKVLTKIVSDVIGSRRLPMLIVDSPSAVKDRRTFSARGAAILGFSMFGKNIAYALDDDLELDTRSIDAFCDKHADDEVLVFGFTYIVHDYFVGRLLDGGRALSLNKGILLHGGGWKRLLERAVDNDTFKRRVGEATGISRVHNYYGMVEQTGSIFVECERGRLHCSNFSDIIVRDPEFAVCGPGTPGLIQLVSLLPESYPGHSLLSEDIGEIVGEDDCPCGRLGKYFLVHGRAEHAEIRGCGDTFSG